MFIDPSFDCSSTKFFRTLRKIFWHFSFDIKALNLAQRCRMKSRLPKPARQRRVSALSTVQEIKSAIGQLPPEARAALIADRRG
jgi:hypothetical protein